MGNVEVSPPVPCSRTDVCEAYQSNAVSISSESCQSVPPLAIHVPQKSQPPTMAEVPSIPENIPAKVPALREDEKYHAFIAHSSEDQKLSYTIAEVLTKCGFICFHADYDFQPGLTIVANIMEGISKSRRVIVLISESFIRSVWFAFETANSLTKGYERKERVMIPVLHDIEPSCVPSYIREVNYIQTNEAEFWKRLVRSITETIPITACIPVPNVAHGLVWSYYYGYLSIILPGLLTRLQESEFSKAKIPFLKKLCIVLPQSCYCPPDIREIDENIEYMGVIPFEARRAGNVERPYPSSVYKITDPQADQEYLTLLEFATPLMSMFEMEQGAMAGLGPQDKIEQMMIFKDKLNEILNHMANAECHGKVVLIGYNDLASQELQPSLSAVLLKRIRHELELCDRLEQLSLSDTVDV